MFGDDSFDHAIEKTTSNMHENYTGQKGVALVKLVSFLPVYHFVHILYCFLNGVIKRVISKRMCSR